MSFVGPGDESTKKPPQYYLADLMAIVAICGLWLGLLQSSNPLTHVVGFVLLIWSVVIVLIARP